MLLSFVTVMSQPSQPLSSAGSASFCSSEGVGGRTTEAPPLPDSGGSLFSDADLEPSQCVLQQMQEKLQDQERPPSTQSPSYSKRLQFFFLYDLIFHKKKFAQ